MKNSASENNFWITYADLMAGLLFVFILLVSAIVSKYVIAAQNLADKSEKLVRSNELVISKDELLKRLKSELAELNLNLASEREDNEKLADLLAGLASEHDEDLKTLSAKDLQIAALAAALNSKDLEISNKAAAIASLQQDLGKIRADFSTLKDYKSALIAKLASKLDDDLLIDLNSGSIKLASNILFASGSHELESASRKELERTLRAYFAALSSSGVLEQIDAIIIEGHTDSDGGYLYNLELSQKRSLEILKFIYSLEPQDEILRKLSAVGRGYLDPVLTAGSEDKTASRRIEIKLIFSSKSAISEYEKRINDINFN